MCGYWLGPSPTRESRSHVRFFCPRASFSFPGRSSSSSLSLSPSSTMNFLRRSAAGKRKETASASPLLVGGTHARAVFLSGEPWGAAQGLSAAVIVQVTQPHSPLSGPFRAFLRLFPCPTFGARSNVARHAINVWRGELANSDKRRSTWASKHNPKCPTTQRRGKNVMERLCKNAYYFPCKRPPPPQPNFTLLWQPRS